MSDSDNEESYSDNQSPMDAFASFSFYQKQNLVVINEDSLDSAAYRNFNDRDYEIARLNKPFIPNRPKSVISPVLAIIDVADYHNIRHTDQVLYTWTDLSKISNADFPSVINSNFKHAYTNLKQDISIMLFNASQTASLENLKDIRKQKCSGRIIFHYIGCGFPPLTHDEIPLLNHQKLLIHDVFRNLSPPFFFIFDCDKAATILPTLRLLMAPMSTPAYISWEDCFVLCSSSADENLPKDPLLPADLFTSILLSPIKTAIYIHTYLHYRSFIELPPQIDPPIYTQLEQLLDTIVEAIVRDCLPPPLIWKLFKQDKTVRELFRNYILAQFILLNFSIHPHSDPEVPDMTRHYLWSQWESAIDRAISSNTFEPLDKYYQRAVQSFDYYVQTDKVNHIFPSLLCTLILGKTTFKKLAQLFKKYPEFRHKVNYLCLFRDLILQLSQSCTKHGLYVVLSLMHEDQNNVVDLPSELDFQFLDDLVFNCKNEQTRVYAAALMAAFAVTHKPIKNRCKTTEFLQKVQQILPTAPVKLATWLLLVIKRAYDVFSADPDVFFTIGFHMQCSIGVSSHSDELRATSIAILPCFLLSSSHLTNLRLILIALPRFSDMSYLVRHQLVILILRYLTMNTMELSKPQHISTINFFSEVIQIQTSSNFVEYTEWVEKFIHQEDAPKKLDKIVQFLITYFAYDPHNAIAAEAATARAFFDKWNVTSYEEEEDYGGDDSLIPFESDSDALYNIVLRHTVASKSNENLYDDDPIHERTQSYTKEISKIAFDPCSRGITVATGKQLEFYTNSSCHRVQFFNSIVSDIKMSDWGGPPTVVATTARGTAAIWTVGSYKPTVIWRSDPNFLVDNIPQYVALTHERPLVITARKADLITVWDVNKQQILSEIPTRCDSNVSALATHHSFSNLVFHGYKNGRISMSDVRTQKLIFEFQDTKSEVIHIGGAPTGDLSIIGAFECGKAACFDSQGMEQMEFIKGNRLFSFDSHPVLPYIAYSTYDSYPVVMQTKDGLVTPLAGLSPKAHCAIHPKQQLFAFGVSKKMLSICKVKENQAAEL